MGRVYSYRPQKESPRKTPLKTRGVTPPNGLHRGHGGKHLSFETIKETDANPSRAVVFPLGLFAVFLSGCQSAPKTADAAGAPPASSVSFVEVKAQDVPIYSEYAAQTFARDLVEVRGRVNGYIEKRTFQSAPTWRRVRSCMCWICGRQAEVARNRDRWRKSQANLEFARKQVALAQAEADLAQAQANLLKAQQDVDRLGRWLRRMPRRCRIWTPPMPRSRRTRPT